MVGGPTTWRQPAVAEPTRQKCSSKCMWHTDSDFQRCGKGAIGGEGPRLLPPSLPDTSTMHAYVVSHSTAKQRFGHRHKHGWRGVRQSLPLRHELKTEAPSVSQVECNGRCRLLQVRKGVAARRAGCIPSLPRYGTEMLVTRDPTRRSFKNKLIKFQSNTFEIP